MTKIRPKSKLEVIFKYGGKDTVKPLVTRWNARTYHCMSVNVYNAALQFVND